MQKYDDQKYHKTMPINTRRTGPRSRARTYGRTSLYLPKHVTNIFGNIFSAAFPCYDLKFIANP